LIKHENVVASGKSLKKSSRCGLTTHRPLLVRRPHRAHRQLPRLSILSAALADK
jgi:hypothetical protein